MLDGTITDLLESKALLFKPNYINIYSASWGPIDDGATMEGPKPLAKAALQEGVKKVGILLKKLLLLNLLEVG